MRAILCTGYGSTDVLKLEDVAKPNPNENEVLIKIYTTTCHIGDVRVRSFDVPFWQKIPFRLYLGVTKPKRPILGMELAGVVEETGKNVKRFKVGDEIFATTGFEFGAHAEYVCMAENNSHVKNGFIAIKPKNLSFEEAAAGAPTGGLTALELIKKAKIDNNKDVLIYGASGSVGIFATQLAKHFGAKITGICSTKNLDLVKSLGADHVIDYTKQDIENINERYDVVIDCVDKLATSIAKKLIKSNGKYLNVNKNTNGENNIKLEDFLFLKDLLEKNKLKVIIDKTYKLEDMKDAHKYVQKGHKVGSVVINVLKDE